MISLFVYFHCVGVYDYGLSLIFSVPLETCHEIMSVQCSCVTTAQNGTHYLDVELLGRSLNLRDPHSPQHIPTWHWINVTSLSVKDLPL